MNFQRIYLKMVQAQAKKEGEKPKATKVEDEFDKEVCNFSICY